MERITLLPHWVLTNVRPGFYDTDSGTTIEQTAKVYRAMRELQSDYNKFVDEINTCITEFVDSINKDQEEFEEEITKIIHDYIKTLDLKIAHQDRVIEESIVYIKENITDGVRQVLTEMKESGELAEVITSSIDEMVSRITTIEADVNTNKSDIETIKSDIDLLKGKNLINSYDSLTESLTIEYKEV